MKQGEFMDGYLSRTLAIVNKMCIHGEKIKDAAVVEKILRPMDSKFAYVVCSIAESKDIDTLCQFMNYKVFYLCMGRE